MLDPAGLIQFSFSLCNAASQEQRWGLDLSNSSQSPALATSQPMTPGGCLFMQSSIHRICASRRWGFDDEKGMAVITMGLSSSLKDASARCYTSCSAVRDLGHYRSFWAMGDISKARFLSPSIGSLFFKRLFTHTFSVSWNVGSSGILLNMSPHDKD